MFQAAAANMEVGNFRAAKGILTCSRRAPADSNTLNAVNQLVAVEVDDEERKTWLWNWASVRKWPWTNMVSRSTHFETEAEDFKEQLNLDRAL